MIIVQLNGGLGNQMFQYAAGRERSLSHKVPLLLDLSAFRKFPSRSYRLGYFNIHADIAQDEEVARFWPDSAQGLFARALSLPDYFKPWYARAIVREPHFQYDPDIKKTGPDAYLLGVWQSEAFFNEITPVIRKDFTLNTPLDEKNTQMTDAIDRCESVSIHVRRGDYVSDQKTHAFHGTCSEDYYQAAISNVGERVRNPHFFIFSDDPHWAETNLKIPYPSTVVDINGPEKDYADLILLSRCRHHIIANSSFSWWGAWLSKNPEKTVIAPKRWFAVSTMNTDDLIPQSWIRL